MLPESSAALTAAARAAGMELDRGLVERINHAIGRADTDAELGRLYVALALALQSAGQPADPALAARRAVPFLVASDNLGTAALASAMAASWAVQLDQLAEAVDLAVDAVVMLHHAEDDPVDAVRAHLALAGFFQRLSAFELSVTYGRRAFDGALLLPSGVRIDSVAYSYGYVCAEGAHTTSDQTSRTELAAEANRAADWLSANGGEVSRTLLAEGLRGEVAHITGACADTAALDAGAQHYGRTSPDIAAWHRLVRACALKRRGELVQALELFDEAIPVLASTREDHCLVRALTERSAVRESLGDLAGALSDARRLAGLARSWQVEQVGRLSSQILACADLQGVLEGLREESALLLHDVEHDVTTGVRSRLWWERRKAALASRGGPIALAVLDLDRFKEVNDQLGHQVGDEVLAVIGGLLTAALPAGAEAARLGGDEFVVVLDLPADVPDGGPDVVALAERIRLAVSDHAWGQVYERLAVTASVGTAVGDAQAVEKVLDAADRRLLSAKRHGRNRVA